MKHKLIGICAISLIFIAGNASADEPVHAGHQHGPQATTITHAPADHAAALDSALKEYFEIGKSLAADSVASVKEKATDIAKIITTHVHATGFDKIKAAAENMTGPDIAKLREQFGKLSHALLAQLKNYKLKTAYHIFYCDMVKRHWMQEDAKPANPYGGKEMSTCGQMIQ